jgi:hypothetical protein
LDERLLNTESSLIKMRPATVEDVPFIFDIRHSPRGQWLNVTSPEIADQYSYFDKYLQRYENGDEIYFMIHDKKKGRDSGIVRMTRILEPKNFGWEGLVMTPDSTPGCALDVAASIYSMGFDWLERDECGPWKVLKANVRVMRMHELMKIARKIGEEDLNWLVSVKKSDFVVGIDSLRARGFGRIHDEW